MGHGEQVVGDFGSEAVETDQDRVVVDVVAGAVVEVGRLGEERGTVAAVHAKHEGVGLGGFVGGDAGHQLPFCLEGGGAEGGGFLDTGEGAADAEDGGDGHGDRLQGTGYRGALGSILRVRNSAGSNKEGANAPTILIARCAATQAMSLPVTPSTRLTLLGIRSGQALRAGRRRR